MDKTFFDSIDFLRIKQMLIRFICSLSIFAVTVFFTPNFDISSFPILILSSLVIVMFDYIVSVITGIHDIPFGRGVVGFVSAAVIIYATQYFVSGYYITIISSLIAALIYGVVNSMLPNKS